MAKKNTERVLVRELRKLTYEVRGFFVNSAAMGVCQSRTRLFVVAVDPSQLELTEDPSKWANYLEASSVNE